MTLRGKDPALRAKVGEQLLAGFHIDVKDVSARLGPQGRGLRPGRPS